MSEFIKKLFNSRDLAARWELSIRTLEQWRWRGIGPNFIRIGSRIRYSLEEVERYEREHIFSNTTQY